MRSSPRLSGCPSGISYLTAVFDTSGYRTHVYGIAVIYSALSPKLRGPFSRSPPRPLAIMGRRLLSGLATSAVLEPPVLAVLGVVLAPPVLGGVLGLLSSVLAMLSSALAAIGAEGAAASSASNCRASNSSCCNLNATFSRASAALSSRTSANVSWPSSPVSLRHLKGLCFHSG